MTIGAGSRRDATSPPPPAKILFLSYELKIEIVWEKNRNGNLFVVIAPRFTIKKKVAGATERVILWFGKMA